MDVDAYKSEFLPITMWTKMLSLKSNPVNMPQSYQYESGLLIHKQIENNEEVRKKGEIKARSRDYG